MRANIATVEAQALKLSPQDRAQLADKLLASLSADPEVEEAWFTEAQRRLAELDSGAALTLPVEDAIARARSAIK
jgi:putative addiction module component (TIGR02574 family)